MGLLDSLFRRGARELGNGIGNSIRNAVSTKKYSYKFETLPKTLEEMKALPEASLKDPAAVAALIVIALDRYGEDREECVKMMNFLKGPEPLSEMERQQINNQYMDGRNYVARSYMKGATPENNYTPQKPYVIEPFETQYSRDETNENYIKIFIESGGADSARFVILRNKPSTGQWFANQFQGLLTGIRIPKEQDKWA